jgi:hypothetical protein
MLHRKIEHFFDACGPDGFGLLCIIIMLLLVPIWGSIYFISKLRHAED